MTRKVWIKCLRKWIKHKIGIFLAKIQIFDRGYHFQVKVQEKLGGLLNKY